MIPLVGPLQFLQHDISSHTPCEIAETNDVISPLFPTQRIQKSYEQFPKLVLHLLIHQCSVSFFFYRNILSERRELRSICSRSGRRRRRRQIKLSEMFGESDSERCDEPERFLVGGELCWCISMTQGGTMRRAYQIS